MVASPGGGTVNPPEGSGDAGPAVSVVIPTYQRRETVERVVRATLEQLGPDDEIVVVDDGSRDGTVERLLAVADRRLRVFSQPNSGPAAARNHGAQRAHNQLIVFLDDDEQPEPGLVEAHRRAHAAGEHLAVIGRPILVVRLRGRWRRIAPEARTADHLLTDASFSIRRADFLAVTGFDVAIRRGEDIDLGIRLERIGVRVTVAPDALVAHHIERGYTDFRRQRMAGGRGLAVVLSKHAGTIPPPGRARRRTDRVLLAVAVRSRVGTELIAAGLWAAGRLGALWGSWRVQAVAAGRAGMMIAARAEALEQRRLEAEAQVVRR